MCSKTTISAAVWRFFLNFKLPEKQKEMLPKKTDNLVEKRNLLKSRKTIFKFFDTLIFLPLP